MPHARERRHRESSRNEDHYIILVHNIPRYCRWQELKDMTRSLGGEQSLKAEVFDVGNGTQMGHCTIKGKSDAVKVYENLCAHGWNGHRVHVKLSSLEKDGSLTTIEGPKESNGVVIDSTRVGSRPISQGVPVTTHATSHPMYATSSQPVPSMAYNAPCTSMNGWTRHSGVLSPAVVRPPSSYQNGGFASCTPYIPTSTQAMAPSTHYSTHCPNKGNITSVSSALSLPVRPFNDGTTIFLSGLPYYQTENELRGLLKRFGNLTYLEIHPDKRNPGKNKGTARARYKTSSEALDAVRGLDNKTLRERKISVKLERDDPSLTPSTRGSTSASVRKSQPSQRSKESGATNAAPKQPPQKKNVAFSSTKSSATKSKSKKKESISKGGGSRSGGKSGPSNATHGPLVVNGARRPSSTRIEESSDDSDNSSDEDKDGSDDHSADEGLN